MVVTRRDVGELTFLYFAFDTSDAALAGLAGQCVEAHLDDNEGITCFGYRSEPDVDFDSPDGSGSVLHTCFRVQSRRTPDGSVFTEDDTSDLRSGGCPSDVAERDANGSPTSQTLELGESGPGGLPLPSGAEEAERVGDWVHYTVEGATVGDLVSFYARYAPTGEHLAPDWEWCETGPLMVDAVDGRIWTKPGPGEYVPELDLELSDGSDGPLIRVYYVTDGLPCGF